MRNPLERRDSVVAHQATPQGGLQVPLQPLERLDPPTQRTLVFVPIWTRSWREGAVVVVWLIVNPIMFREPKNDKAWATRAMLGEEMWIAERPLDRAMALGVGATAFGLGGVGSLQATSIADGGMHGRAGGTALGALARAGSLLRTPPRRR